MATALVLSSLLVIFPVDTEPTGLCQVQSHVMLNGLKCARNTILVTIPVALW
jgi:hypothetical protein